MICPVCGCQQREANRCVQCYTTLTPDEEAEEKSSAFLEDRSIASPPEDAPSMSAPSLPVKEKKSRPVKPPEVSDTQIKRRKKTGKPKTATEDPPLGPEKKEVPSRVLPSKPMKEDPFRRIPSRQQPIRGEKISKILVTTTQRIEGRRITSYFGLISADIILELGGSSSLESGQIGKSVNAHYRGELKKGMLTVLRDLRGEAMLLGANAVIATSFNFQKMDLQALLVSAVGTAVHMENRT